MGKFLISLIEKCTVTVEFTGDRCRIAGKGVFGILGVIALLALIVHFAPQLLGLGLVAGN